MGEATRRDFMRTAIALGMVAGPGKLSESRLEGFKTTAPSSVFGELDDRRLLFSVDGPSGVVSDDAGRTWSKPFRYMQEGKPLAGMPMAGRATARLSSGDLGMVYATEEKHGKGCTLRRWFYASSRDDGRSWTAGSPIDVPATFDITHGTYVQFLWGALRQLRSGRLLCTGYWYMGGRYTDVSPAVPYPAHGYVAGQRVNSDGHLFEAAMGGCYAYFSDDSGKSWSRSTGSLMVWPLPGEDGLGGFGAAWEPVTVELKDGRVLMLLRTNVGRIFQSISADGGDHWSLPKPTELASGDVPCCVGRLRTTGDLLVVWEPVVLRGGAQWILEGAALGGNLSRRRKSLGEFQDDRAQRWNGGGRQSEAPSGQARAPQGAARNISGELRALSLSQACLRPEAGGRHLRRRHLSRGEARATRCSPGDSRGPVLQLNSPRRAASAASLPFFGGTIWMMRSRISSE